MKILSKLVLTLCAFTMAFTSLSAGTDQEHSKVGDRCTYEQLLAFRKMRAQEDEANQQNIAQIPEEEHPAAQEEGRISAGWLFNPTLSHHGSHHHAINISPKGDTLELEDGSIWSTSHGDRHKSKDWLPEDILTLTPNHSWFSSYDYRFNNQTTGSSIEVNITLGPLLANKNVHRIFAMDAAKGILTLTDGSQWDMSWFDRAIVDEFQVHDFVILGTNDGWWKSFNPNIIFNCATMKHARASRVN